MSFIWRVSVAGSWALAVQKYSHSWAIHVSVGCLGLLVAILVDCTSYCTTAAPWQAAQAQPGYARQGRERTGRYAAKRNETCQGDYFVVTLFALAAALLYGSADFLGGVATRRARALSILPASAFAGLVIVLVAALAAGESARLAGLAWGLAAGAVGGIGLIIFYIGLGEGPMTVVAPTLALTATILPVAVSFADGERATAAVYAGGLICLAAIVLVSAAGSPAGNSAAGSPAGVSAAASGGAATGDRTPSLASRLASRGFHVRAIGYGLAAGATFGLFFVFLRNAGQSGAFWPIVASRLAGFLIIFAAAGVTRTRPVITVGGARLLLATFGSGMLDASANVGYVIATREGLFGLAVVLTSLYPGVTVLLARFVLGERLRATQLAGLLLAVVGVVLVTV
jgi:drug/metabolite transporter (DMT)-like permease